MNDNNIAIATLNGEEIIIVKDEDCLVVCSGDGQPARLKPLNAQERDILVGWLNSMKFEWMEPIPIAFSSSPIKSFMDIVNEAVAAGSNVDPIVNGMRRSKQNQFTTDKYWDCDCYLNYIHPVGLNSCTICGAERDCDHPDAHASEVEAAIGQEMYSALCIQADHYDWVRTGHGPDYERCLNSMVEYLLNGSDYDDYDADVIREGSEFGRTMFLLENGYVVVGHKLNGQHQ